METRRARKQGIVACLCLLLAVLLAFSAAGAGKQRAKNVNGLSTSLKFMPESSNGRVLGW